MVQAPKYTWIQILQDKWWIGVVSLLVSLLATPLLRLVAPGGEAGARDAELSGRKRKAPFVGGLAICVGLLAGLVGSLFAMPNVGDRLSGIFESLTEGSLQPLLANPLWNLLGIAAGTVTITVVGLLTDTLKIGRKRRLAGQALAAGMLLVGGVGIRMGYVVLGPLGLSQSAWLLVPVSIAMCAVAVMALTNATKVLGDLEGLCSGVTGIVAVAFLALTVWLAMWGHFPGTDELRVALCLAMVGAVLGFLPYNSPPASAALGNSGLMLLGFFVATMMVMFCQEGHSRWLLGSVAVFAVPILDTAVAVLRRINARRSIFADDRSHLHHQLIDRGLSIKQVVTLFYMMTAITSVLGVLVAVFVRLRYALPVYLVLMVGLLIVLRVLGFLTPEKQPGRPRAAFVSGPLNILFTCVGRRVSLLQEFRRAAADLDVELVIHACDASELAPGLKVADKTFEVPKVDNPEYIPRLLEYCRQNNVHGLVPLIDPELLPLAKVKERFARSGTRIIVSAPEVIRICMDKALTSEFLLKHGFRTPHILTAEELQSPSFPLFIKPRCGSASIEAHKVESAQALSYYTQQLSDIIVQEFIEGSEYTVDVFADFQGKARCAVPRQRLAVLAGEISKGQVVRDPQIMAESCRLVEALGGCEGLITVQCFLTRQKEVVFIETNPRFGGGVPLSIQAGADSPRWLMELLMGREPTVTMRAWTDGLVMLRYDRAIYVKPEQKPEGK